MLNISNYAFTLDNNLNWYGNTLRKIAGLIEAEKLAAPSINVLGNFSLKTVQQAHNIMENNLTRGKKLVMTIDY